MFFVGQKVVFVGYPVPTVMMAGTKVIDRVQYCEVGSVYTVLGVCQRSRFRRGKWRGQSLFLGFSDVEHGRVWHHSFGFRPVVERKTDISIFKAMLNPSDKRVDA